MGQLKPSVEHPLHIMIGLFQWCPVPLLACMLLALHSLAFQVFTILLHLGLYQSVLGTSSLFPLQDYWSEWAGCYLWRLWHISFCSPHFLFSAPLHFLLDCDVFCCIVGFLRCCFGWAGSHSDVICDVVTLAKDEHGTLFNVLHYCCPYPMSCFIHH